MRFSKMLFVFHEVLIKHVRITATEAETEITETLLFLPIVTLVIIFSFFPPLTKERQRSFDIDYAEFVC